MNNLRCTICDVPVNTHEQLRLHENGKAHHKKLQQKQLMANWNMSDTAVEPATFWCDLCKISCSTAENLALHKTGINHQNLEKAQCSRDNISSSFLPTSFRCKLCDVECNTHEQLIKHERGSKHLKREQQTSTRPSQARNSSMQPQVVGGVIQYRCQVCDIFCNTPEQLAIHERGEKHVKKLNSAAHAPTKPFNPTVGSPLQRDVDFMCTRCDESFQTADQLYAHQCSRSSSFPPTPPMSQMEANIKAGFVVNIPGSKEMRCCVCSSTCNTPQAMEVHVSGTRHQKNLKKMPREAIQNVLPGLEDGVRQMQLVRDTGPVSNGDMVKCEVCCLMMNVNNAESHFKGKQHKQKLVKAVKAPEHPVQRPAINRQPLTQSFGTKTTPRRYQEELFHKAIQEDCVVFLPTGTGKTLVSAMVLASMLDSNPNYQAVFLVEKTLLVLQQADYLREELQTPLKRFDWETKAACVRQPLIASVCGDLTDIGEGNRYLWQQDIIVTTVAFYLNLLQTRALMWDDVCLVVFDEAHHCVKDHPFNRLLREFSIPKMQSMRPKILGLTASPAGQPSFEETYCAAKQLLENMGKVRIVTVEQNKADLESYSSSCEIRTCIDAADPKEDDLQRHLMSTAAEIFDRVLPMDYRKFTSGLRAELANPNIPWDQVSKLTERLVVHARKTDPSGATLVELCLQTFYELQAGGWALAAPRLNDLQERLKMIPPHLSTLKTVSKLNAAANAAAVTNVSSINISCVMSNLVDLVAAGLQRSPLLKEGKAVVLVLTSQRSIARSVVDYLDSHIREKIADVQVTHIVGHGSTSGQSVTKQLGARSQLTKGMSVGQQKKMLQKIQGLEFKVIVATSVAEEGVDLPSCGLVILLAPPSTMTALVQMRGRARLKESEFVVLTREAEQERKMMGLLTREENMKRAVERIVAEQKTVRWD